MEMEEAINELYRRRERAKQLGGEKRVKAQHDLGRLTVRERIDKLLDSGSFWEMGVLNHSDVPEVAEITPADGRVCGIGAINGRKVAVIGEDRTIFGGSGGHVGGMKAERLRRIADERGYPIIGLGDEIGGVRLPDWLGSAGLARGVSVGAGAEGVRYHLPRKTLRIEAIMGECFGEPSWNAARADFVVMVKGTAMGAAGPRIIEEAIGEKITPQELCGWEIHANYTGQIDAFAENDEECLEIVKKFLSYMPSHTSEEPPSMPTQDDVNRRIDNVEKLVPVQLNRGYDMYRFIRALVDDGQYFPLKKEFGPAIVTCLARLGGRVVGIIANNPLFHAGAPDIQAIEKSTSFICLCDSYNIPIVFLGDVPGMYPGTESEKLKLPTKIVVLIEAMELATVPKVHVLLRKAYGIGWACMGARQAELTAAWPTASISFVEPTIGVELVYGRKLAESADSEAEKGKLVEKWSVDSAPWGAAGVTALEVIDPRDTRKWIAEALDILRGNRGSTISEHNLANWPTGF